MQDRFDTNTGGSKLPKSSPYSSPYLNFDPAILNPSGSSQFIVPEGQDATRGKMEMAFFTIGTSLTIGGAFGGLNGLFNGIKETKNMPKNIRYSQIVNFVGKRGSVSAQTLGAFALMYSLYDTIVTNIRGVDDEFNSVSAGVLTGVTYRTPHGLRPMAKGGAVGLALTLAYLSYTKKDALLGALNSST